MTGVSPYQFLRLSEAHGNSEAFTQAIFHDAKILAQKQLPIIFTLNHLAKLSGSGYKFLHNIIERKCDPYYHFTIPKRNGTRRPISTPGPILSDVLNYIKSKILDSPYVSNLVDEAVFSYQKNRSIVGNARAHIGANWLIKIDIKDFFQSITEAYVYKFFTDLGYASLLSFELARLVTWPRIVSYTSPFEPFSKYKFYTANSGFQGSLPQGAATSPQLSNVIFAPVDKELKALALMHGCMYTRYADDLFFSSHYLENSSVKLIISEANRLLGNSGYILNKKKTKVFTPGTKKVVTGIVVTNNRLRLKKDIKEEIKKHVFFAEKNGLEHQAGHAGSRNSLSFLRYLYGMLNFAHQIEPDFASKWYLRLKIIVRHHKIINREFY